MENIKTIDLGFIGNKAEKLAKLFEGYTAEPNENGYFLRFSDTNIAGNKGVVVYTNCFEDEAHFMEQLNNKLIMMF